MLESVITETFRVLEPGGRVATNLGRKPYIPLNHHIAALLVDVGFQLRGEIIWQKAKGASGSTAWGSWQSARNPVLRDVHEYIVVASKGRPVRETLRRQRHESTVTAHRARIPCWDAPRGGGPSTLEKPRRSLGLRRSSSLRPMVRSHQSCRGRTRF